MTQQNINIGTVANDGTGDPLRDAFDKVNSNFTEIATDLATAISSIPTDVSDLTDNNNLLTGGAPSVDLSAVNQSIVPDTDVAYDLGSPSHRFKDLHLSGNTIYLGDAQVSADPNGKLIVPGINRKIMWPSSIADWRGGTEQEYYNPYPLWETGNPDNLQYFVIDQLFYQMIYHAAEWGLAITEYTPAYLYDASPEGYVTAIYIDGSDYPPQPPMMQVDYAGLNEDNMWILPTVYHGQPVQLFDTAMLRTILEDQTSGAQMLLAGVFSDFGASAPQMSYDDLFDLPVVPTDVSDLTDSNGLLNTTGELQISGTTIMGAAVGAAGTAFSINANYDGAMASVNGNGLLVDPTLVGLDQIVSGWTVTFSDQTTAVVETSYNWPAGGYWVIQLVDNINKDGDMLWPIILKSPDYNAGQPTRLALSSGNTAPGSAVVINETSVDVNFSGFGTKFKFKPDGTITDGANNLLIGDAVTSVNGQTGNVLLNVLPSTPQELLTGLYATPLSLTATGISDGGTLKATFNGSVQAQAMVDDETLHAFGKSLHNTPTYDLFFGNQPPLTLNWNLPNNELNRTFVCASLNRDSEVDNEDGTFTVTPNVVRASIPSAFTDGVPTAWMQMDGTQLLAAIEGNDVIVPGVLGAPEVAIAGSQQYADAVKAELTNMQCYSKYTTIMHLVAASLGDFIQ